MQGKKKIFAGNESGFMLLSVIFLTLIISFAAVILMNAGQLKKNSQSTLRQTAIFLANGQLAEIESRAAAGNLSGGSVPYLGDSDNLTTYNAGKNFPVTFTVRSEVSDTASENLKSATVRVIWIFDGKENEVKFSKTIYAGGR